MIKRIIVGLFFIFTIVQLFAQDVITKKDGSEIEAKILEVYEEEIHYKKFDNIEGPTYIVETSKLQSVQYQNGDYESYAKVEEKTPEPDYRYQQEPAQKLSEEIEVYGGSFYYKNRRVGTAQIERLIKESENEAALKMWRNSKINQGVAYGLGFATIPLGIITYFGTLGLTGDQLIDTALGLGGFVLANAFQATNYVLRSVYKNQREGAIDLYNQGVKNQVEHDDGDYY